MKIINKRNNIKWLDPESTLTLIETNEYNFNVNLITSVFCFIVKNNKILVIYNKKPNRGFEIPGGHVEPNEAYIEALHRECLEESMIEIENPRLVAIHEIDNKKEGKYPKKGYQTFYIANAKKIKPFEENEEISQRKWMTKEEFKDLEWSKYYPDLVKIALNNI